MTAWLALVAALAKKQPAHRDLRAQRVLECYCTEVSPAKPDPAAVAEIDARVGDFQTAWATDEPRWMAQTIALAGRPIPSATPPRL